MFDEKKIQHINQHDNSATHNAIIENRERVCLSGVVDIDTFNEKFVQLYTNMGMVMINGEDMHINKLSVETGELVIDGYICGLEYQDKQSHSGGSLLKRIFR